jgi:hypothetical protein
MKKRLVCLASALILSVLCGSAALSADQPATTKAVVTAIEGSAQAFTKGRTSGRALKKGDKLGREHEVRVGDKSRIEIRFPDGTIMRLSERSRLAMSEIQYDKKSESKKVRVNLGVGKLWANVRKLITPDSSVEVKTGTAVAGVRGTVYRMNVEEDKSSLVRVYDGSVAVSSLPKEESGKPSTHYSTPVPVPGPHEVPPPMHEVTMEEWHVIVKAMQQVSISSQGVASKAEDFDAKADADDWVKWNQERDKQIQL